MTEDRKPETPGMTEVSAKFVDEAEAVTTTPPPSTNQPDDPLTALVDDYYAAYTAFDTAWAARDAAEGKARVTDQEAAYMGENMAALDGVFLSSVFETIGTLSPTLEQVSRYASTKSFCTKAESEKLIAAVMQHLEQYGERCVAAFEAQDWPKKQYEVERTEQRRDEIYAEIVTTPARGLRGVCAKVRGLVYPHEWEFLRDGKLDDFDDQINTEMLTSLVADVERLAGERTATAFAGALAPQDAVVLLRQRWENVRVAREQVKYREGEGPNDPDVLEDERLHDVQHDIEESIAATPTHTAAGIVAKLLQLQRNETEFDGDAPWRPAAFKTALDALGRGTMPTTNDVVLFAALAEYDRLVAVEQGLERRKDVFRPGVPEAEEATKAYEAAHDEAMKAWEKARDIPATTQTGLVAKLQGAVRFVTDLGEDELYEAEWHALKADVLNLGDLPGKGMTSRSVCGTVPAEGARS